MRILLRLAHVSTKPRTPVSSVCSPSTVEAWARRWETADVVVEGDPGLQQALRLTLFHLMASVGDHGEAAVGARGLSGPAYRGHVFWDSDVFVLPFLAATHPPAARAMLEYRIRRLPAALEAARRLGRMGARFPWESAADGWDVTPRSAFDQVGRLVRIRTGELEEHIVADVAWATACYLDWTGDGDFEDGPGRDLLVQTARYWASRIRLDREGRGHIYGVIGPDEYHEPVDDNAFTNVMARWNLRRGAELAVSDEERIVGCACRMRSSTGTTKPLGSTSSSPASSDSSRSSSPISRPGGRSRQTYYWARSASTRLRSSNRPTCSCCTTSSRMRSHRARSSSTSSTTSRGLLTAARSRRRSTPRSSRARAG